MIEARAWIARALVVIWLLHVVGFTAVPRRSPMLAERLAHRFTARTIAAKVADQVRSLRDLGIPVPQASYEDHVAWSTAYRRTRRWSDVLEILYMLLLLALTATFQPDPSGQLPDEAGDAVLGFLIVFGIALVLPPWRSRLHYTPAGVPAAVFMLLDEVLKPPVRTFFSRDHRVDQLIRGLAGEVRRKQFRRRRPSDYPAGANDWVKSWRAFLGLPRENANKALAAEATYLLVPTIDGDMEMLTRNMSQALPQDAPRASRRDYSALRTIGETVAFAVAVVLLAAGMNRLGIPALVLIPVLVIALYPWIRRLGLPLADLLRQESTDTPAPEPARAPE